MCKLGSFHRGICSCQRSSRDVCQLVLHTSKPPLPDQLWFSVHTISSNDLHSSVFGYRNSQSLSFDCFCSAEAFSLFWNASGMLSYAPPKVQIKGKIVFVNFVQLSLFLQSMHSILRGGMCMCILQNHDQICTYVFSGVHNITLARVCPNFIAIFIFCEIHTS